MTCVLVTGRYHNSMETDFFCEPHLTSENAVEKDWFAEPFLVDFGGTTLVAIFVPWIVDEI